MKILVTGETGQLARSLVERQRDWPEFEIITTGRASVDLEVPGNLADHIRLVAPDVVVNAAAYTDVDQAEDEPQRAFRINADGAGEAAGAAHELGAPIIHLSTDYVFDGSAADAYREDAPTGPIGAYGRSKLAGEEEVRAANPRHLILRTAWLYSPFGRNFVKTMLNAARERDVLTVVADQVGSPTSALDLADGLLTAARAIGSGKGGWGLYHLAGSGETSWCGLAEAVMDEAAQVGLPTARVEPITSDRWPTKARRPANSRLDSSKFKGRFGFTMPDWRSSVAEVVKQLKAGA